MVFNMWSSFLQHKLRRFETLKRNCVATRTTPELRKTGAGLVSLYTAAPAKSRETKHTTKTSSSTIFDF